MAGGSVGQSMLCLPPPNPSILLACLLACLRATLHCGALPCAAAQSAALAFTTPSSLSRPACLPACLPLRCAAQSAFGRQALSLSSFFTYVGLGLGLLGSSLALPFGLYVIICQRSAEQYIKVRRAHADGAAHDFRRCRFPSQGHALHALLLRCLLRACSDLLR